MARSRLLAGALTLLAACASRQWTHPTRGEQEMYRDRYGCEREAALTFPVVLSEQEIPNGQGYVPTERTRCRQTYTGKVECETETRPTQRHTYTADENQRARENAVRSCMYALGWRLEEPQSKPGPSVEQAVRPTR